MTAAILCIENDLKQIKADYCNEFIAWIERRRNEPLTVEAVAVPPIHSSIHDVTFTVTMRFREEFPYLPPMVTIIADSDPGVAGTIEAEMANRLQPGDWTPVITIKDILAIMLDLIHTYAP